MIVARAAASGRPSSTTRSARDRNASSTAAAKFVVVTTTVPGRVAARWSSPASTASVARCTSTGFVSKEARLLRTAKLSTSSISTTRCGRSIASDGTTSRSSRTTLRWLSPSISLGRACGSISMRVVAPCGATASAAAWASPRASVVFPVPGGPARTISPLGAAVAGSADSRRAWSIATSAVPSSRSLVPAGITRLCHGPSWWSAGRTCTPLTPRGRSCAPGPGTATPGRDGCGLLTARSAWSAAASPPSTGHRPAGRGCGPAAPRTAPAGRTVLASSPGGCRTCGSGRPARSPKGRR